MDTPAEIPVAVFAMLWLTAGVTLPKFILGQYDGVVISGHRVTCDRLIGWLRAATVLCLIPILARCASGPAPRCHRPIADIVEVRKNTANMVVVVGYVRNASESWFTCRNAKDVPVESNREHREGTVIGEFASLPPDTDYILEMFATNECGMTSVLSTRRFKTPPALRQGG